MTENGAEKCLYFEFATEPYIKANNLQNPQNKREILADDKLQAVFGGKSKVCMFEMNKHFAQHLS
jgi:chromatin remodeling complex protein RSC6